jgi:hypothetical protein
MSNVDESAEARFHRMLMSQPPGRRVVMACRMFSTGMALVRAGLHRQGYVDRSELRQHVFLRLYGDDFTPAERSKILKKIGAA